MSEHANPAPIDENPHTAENTTDDARANMLAEYLEQLTDEFGETPRLMPLDSEGKAPIIQGRCPLDSPEGRSYLVDGAEAVRQIREEGARGFAIYAGKPEHNTEDVVLVDVDDRDTFPYEDFPATLMVLSGSARGEHFTYRNGGNVSNASGKDGVDGEVRAHNWFCVTPGSIHPSGGIYHIYDDREIETLHSEEIPTSLRPRSDRRITGTDGGVTIVTEGDNRALSGNADTEEYEYTPDPNVRPKDVIESNPWIGMYLGAGAAAAGYTANDGRGDRSTADFAACKDFIRAGVSENDAWKVLSDSSHTKVDEVDASANYWPDTWTNALADVIEDCEEHGDPLPWADDDGIRAKFIEACQQFRIDHMQVGTEQRDDETVPVGVDAIVPESSVGDAVMAFNRNADLLDGVDTQAVIGRVVLLDLRERGEFFRTSDDRLFYFHDDELEVYRVDDTGRRILAEDFQGMVWERYNLFAGRFSRNLGDDLKSQAKRAAPTKDVFQFAHYNEGAGELYVTDWDSGYYAVSPETIEWRPNGTDVYFMADSYADPYEYLEDDDRPDLPSHIPGERRLWSGAGDPLMRLFGNRINFDESAALGPSEQRDQLYIHLHTLPFIDVLNARPIMAWAGKKGSGKTVIERSIGRFIYGPEYTESVMPDDKDDFLAKVTNQALAFIDNYDDGVEWANDVLAAIATGAGIDKRELYTTNTLRREVPRCWLSLTSRDPPFRRDDVADRTLVFRVERVEDGFVGMGDYLRQVDDHRDLLWSAYLDNLQAILAEYLERDTGSMSSSHRMADWAIFAKIVADALDIDDVEDLLETMETERATFALENEPWAAVIGEWVQDNPEDAATWRKASALADRLQETAETHDRPFSLTSAPALGSKLSVYRDELTELYNLEVDESRRTNRYRFAVDDGLAPTGLDRY